MPFIVVSYGSEGSAEDKSFRLTVERFLTTDMSRTETKQIHTHLNTQRAATWYRMIPPLPCPQQQTNLVLRLAATLQPGNRHLFLQLRL